MGISLRTYLVAILVIAAIFGCAAPNNNIHANDEYYSKPETIDAAKKDIAVLLINRKTLVSIEFNEPKRFSSENELKKQSEECNNCGMEMRHDSKTLEMLSLRVASFPVSDEKIFIPYSTPLFYAVLPDYQIVVTGSRIKIGNRFTFAFNERDLSDAQRLAHDLLVIQGHLKKQRQEKQEQFVRFEQIASQYRSLAVKTPVSEEQRRLIVQANLLTQQKKYRQSIEQYEKVIKADPASYPGAYYNLALLSAQEEMFTTSVYYMKHYLLLVPNAPDARNAQDKIYEWEFMLQK